MNKVIFCFVISLFFISCDDNNDSGGVQIVSIWDNIVVREISGWNGDVEEVVCYMDDGTIDDDISTPDIDESQSRCMYQKFNARGQIIAYNPTPIDIEDLEPLSVNSGLTKYGFGVSLESYKYSYDGLGRIVDVEMYDIGAFDLTPLTYTISYGDGDVYVPSPFLVGELPVYMLKGVESIESSFGYSMVCEGESVTEVYPSRGWGKYASTTVHTIVDGYTQSVVSETMMEDNDGNDVVVHTTTVRYEWSEIGELLQTNTTVVTPAGDIDVVEDEVTSYSKVHLFRPTNHLWSIDGVVDASYYYKYNEQGLPIEGSYRSGVSYPNKGSYVPMAFEWIYSEFDSNNNWIKKSQDIMYDGQVEFVVKWEQDIKYFSVK